MKHILFTYFLFLFSIISNAQSWNITGNNGTNPPTNFLGTKDNKALVFKTNNAEVMRILANGKIGIGTTNPLQKLHVHGNINIDSGFELYMANHPVLKIDSLLGNIFLGNGIAIRNSGNYNTVSGSEAFNSNTMGTHNTVSGYAALYSNTDGYYNVGAGSFALYNNTSGSYNIAGGYQALYNNLEGNYNTAYGSLALYSNTGNSNTGVGDGAMNETTTGSENTAVGVNALIDNGDSWSNTAIGYYSGHNYWGHNGWNNTFLGSYTVATNADAYNATAIGNSTQVWASNQVHVGNDYVTSIGGWTDWTNVSDRRVKKNIKENVPGLSFINKLKPITYNLDLDAADKLLPQPLIKDKDGKALEPKVSQAEMNARNAKQQIVYTGFIAQDVEKAAKELSYDFSGVDAAKNDKGLYGLRYSQFVVPLVKAVQELNKMNNDKDDEIAALKKQNDNLEQRMTKLETLMNVSTITAKISEASLEQNIPNPYNHTTSIGYSLPTQFSSAKIIITDNNGKILKTVNASVKDKGILQLDASSLASGSYNYSLYVDDRLIDTKKMVLTK
jgi:hypothetical protein